LPFKGNFPLTNVFHVHIVVVLRSEIPSGICAKLRTMASSNNRDHPTRSLYYCLFAPHTYIFVLRAHPVRGESHNQRNASGEVATVAIRQICIPGVESRIVFAMATQYEILAKLIPQPGLLTTACHLVAAVFANLSGTAAKR